MAHAEKDRIKSLSLTVAWLMPKILLICIMILNVQKPKGLIITPKILIALFITDVRHSQTLVQSQGYLWMNYVNCNAFKVKNYMPKVVVVVVQSQGQFLLSLQYTCVSFMLPTKILALLVYLQAMPVKSFVNWAFSFSSHS